MVMICLKMLNRDSTGEAEINHEESQST